MRLLEAVFIKPVEALLSFLFVSFASVTGSYGVALVLLSAAVTALLLPLYYLAERWKIEEQVVQGKMARDLTSIRRHYSGQKRFYLIRNLYRLHGYKSIYALRTSLGLLVQIPFFLAVYNYLSHFQGYAGSQFAFIADLGRQDGLLWGVNLLPFLMTAVNVVASLMYTRLKSVRDAVQLIGLSVFFLVVLYDRPAGLLVYWTMNNILSIPKNSWFARILPAPPPADDKPGTAPASVAATIRAALGPANRDLVLFVLTVTLLAFQRHWQLHYDRSYKYAILITGLIACALSILLLARASRMPPAARPRPALLALAPLWLFFGAAAYLLLFARRQNAYVSNPNIKLITTLILDAVVWVAAAGLTARSTTPLGGEPPHRRLGPLFACSSAFLLAYVLLFSPALVYFSSPQDVGMRLVELLLRNGSAALLLPLAASAVYGRLGRRAQVRTLEAVVALVFVALAYNYLVPGDFGILDELHLEKEYLLDNTTLAQFLLDVAVIAIACAAARALVRLRPAALVPTLIVLTAALVVQVVVKGVKTDRSAFDFSKAAESADLPAEAARVHSFSKDGTNVVVIVADMFNGNYMDRLLAEAPQTRSRLDGFVWYRNTLSISSSTVTSIPSILAGWQYAPEAMNAMAGTGKQKYEGAVRHLLDAMIANGREVSVVDLTYLGMDRINREAYGGRLAVSTSSSYVGYWNRVKGRASSRDEGSAKNRLLAMVAVFQSAPYMLKSAIYDGGSWLIFRKSYQFAKMARNAVKTYAYLDLLPELSTAGSSASTFKLIHTQFTHEPFGVTRAGDIIDNEFPDPQTRSFVDGKSAYYSARKMIDFLAAWTTWMKDHGVYDNTMIVVLSDHGNNAMDSGLKLPPGLDNLLGRWEISRANSLLLVKRFAAAGPLEVDGRFLSNADAAAVLLNAAAGSRAAGEDLTLGQARAGRVLTYSRYYGNWSDFMAEETSKLSVYEVKDDMYVPQNWRKR